MANAPDARLASGKIMVGNSSGVMVPVTPSGDMTITNTGVTAIGAGKVTSAMMSALTIRYATISLNATQACALNSAPQTVVAAPGAGSVVLVHRALLVLNFSGAAITSNGIVGLYETDSSGQVITGTLTLASFLGASADTIKTIQPIDSATTGTTRLDNKAIVLSQATGDSTKGSATSTVDVHCWYSIIPHGL
jgi:hypothetical protein